MKSLKTVNRFKKNLKLQHKRGKNIHKLENFTVFILEQIVLMQSRSLLGAGK